ncbi:hypothetical protein N7452_009547 [Penicillium brevicompactum]|uniref:Uncharacterized protein n=1 Tax=Penicillium brevicompactum TaxID=5074 RepID=A0A9W9Q8H0_PENBR|nr:hypothetical protein N7452_009547 [Penicillium brevicompactum]
MHFAQIAIALAAVPALAMASPVAAPAGDKTVVARSEPSGGVCNGSSCNISNGIIPNNHGSEGGDGKVCGYRNENDGIVCPGA